MYCNKIPSYVLCSFGLLSTLFTVVGADDTLVGLASSVDSLSTLVTALTKADLVTALQGDGPFTVFAPTNESFVDLPEKFLEDDYMEHLTDILTYHVLEDNVTSDQLTLDMAVTMLNGEHASVTQLDPVQVNNVNVSVPDQFASNGVAHIIDGLLTPSWYNKGIKEVLEDEDDNNFSTLLDVLDKANLSEVVDTTDGITLFAPTNDAFGKLDDDFVAELVDAANSEYLAEVLTYHVLVGIYSGAELLDIIESGMTVPTFNNKTLSFNVTNLDYFLYEDHVSDSAYGEIVINNSSEVIQIGKYAFNGIIHSIDTVLIPPDSTPSPTSAPSKSPSKAPTPDSSGFVPSTSTIGVFLLCASMTLFL